MPAPGSGLRASGLTRRAFGAATLGALTVFSRSLRAAEYNFIQYHNQTPTSSLHTRLVEMWAAIGKETNGRVETQVFAQNNGIAGSDPAALKLLIAGDIQFFTLMGGILGTVVPVAEVQQVPFAWTTAPQAHRAADGPLGAYVRAEMAAKGIQGFATGAFDNGMRQITTTARPIVAPSDLSGIRMRVPAGEMVADTFKALGAEPIVINSADIHAALKSGKVDAQENPLALIDNFKLYEVVKYVSLSNHMWSGFNQMAHLPTWQRLPKDVQTVIDRHVTRYVQLQRQDQESANVRMRAELVKRGLVFNDVDPAPFRRQLSAFYVKWKGVLGTKCWTLLQESSQLTS
jgi:tripartite ATP-independent transporter DctP family solute receptor